MGVSLGVCIVISDINGFWGPHFAPRNVVRHVNTVFMEQVSVSLMSELA